MMLVSADSEDLMIISREIIFTITQTTQQMSQMDRSSGFHLSWKQQCQSSQGLSIVANNEKIRR